MIKGEPPVRHTLGSFCSCDCVLEYDKNACVKLKGNSLVRLELPVCVYFHLAFPLSLSHFCLQFDVVVGHVHASLFPLQKLHNSSSSYFYSYPLCEHSLSVSHSFTLSLALSSSFLFHFLFFVVLIIFFLGQTKVNHI